MDYSPPGSSIYGILQARVLEWVAICFSRGSSRPRDRTWVSCIVGRRFTIWATREIQSLVITWSEKFIWLHKFQIFNQKQLLWATGFFTLKYGILCISILCIQCITILWNFEFVFMFTSVALPLLHINMWIWAGLPLSGWTVFKTFEKHEFGRFNSRSLRVIFF